MWLFWRTLLTIKEPSGTNYNIQPYLKPSFHLYFKFIMQLRFPLFLPYHNYIYIYIYIYIHIKLLQNCVRITSKNSRELHNSPGLLKLEVIFCLLQQITVIVPEPFNAYIIGALHLDTTSGAHSCPYTRVRFCIQETFQMQNK